MTDGRTQDQGKSVAEEERYEKEGSGEGGSGSDSPLPSNDDEEKLFRAGDDLRPEEGSDGDSPAQS